MATKPSTEFLAIPATDLSLIENRMAVDRLRSLIATNGAYIKSQDGVADEFSDETGVESSVTGYLANSIPTMTGTSAPSGTAIFDAESSPTYAAWKAFDNSASTRWARNSAGQVGWVGYDFGSGNGKIISKMVFTAPTSGNGEMPKNFTIEGNGSSGVTYTVTVQSVGGSNKYFVNGVQQVTLQLSEGNTYIFNYPSGHPFKFSTTSDGTHGGGAEYTTGVTHNSGTQVTIIVASGAPTLYYYCSSHSAMGGTANTPTDWVVLETITNAAGYSTSETRDYVFTNTTSYQKYRVNVTVSQDATNVTMGGLAMHEYVTALSANTTYDATGDYYNNPPGGSLSVITNVVGAVYSHSSIYASGYTSAFAFNDDLSTRWAASSNNTGWVQIDLGAGNEKTLVKITMHANGGGDNQCVDGFTFLGSNDGSSFTTLYTMANGQATTEFGTGAGPSLATFNFTNTTAYRYYRVNITQTGTSSSRSLATVYELYGYEAVTTAASMTLVSDTFTAQTAPSEASLVLLHQPVDSVVLNTDVLAYISRDGGTTYTQGTLASGGEYSTGINILTVNGLDISAQPSGTNIKYKIVTANVKEQRFHGVWLQWS